MQIFVDADACPVVDIVEKIAETYDLEIGDEIFLYDENRNEMKMTISGICQNFMYRVGSTASPLCHSSKWR